MSSELLVDIRGWRDQASESTNVLRSLPWACGLSFFEVLRFGHCTWWWKLRWAVWREFRELDIEALVNSSRGGELSYGETPTVTLARILELAELAPGAGFVDLGSGRGVTVVAAALLGYRAAGMELLNEYVERSRKVATRVGVEVDFGQGDFLLEEWPKAELYLLNSTAFPADFRQRLNLRFQQLESGTLVCTYDWELESAEFDQLHALRLPVTRGTVLCRLFRVR